MELKEALGEIYKKAREQFDIQNVPSLHLKQDRENAQGIFGKTAYYKGNLLFRDWEDWYKNYRQTNQN